MEPLGARSQINTVLSNEEQRSLLPSSKDTIRCSSLDTDNYIFSEETMQGLRELGAVLQNIHNRLIAQGYTIKDGIITKPHDHTRINHTT